MILPLHQITWDDNANAYTVRAIGINPEAVAHVEQAEEVNGQATISVWLDRSEKAYRVIGTVEEAAALINEYCGYRPCAAAN